MGAVVWEVASVPCAVLAGTLRDRGLGRGGIRGALSGAEAMGPVLFMMRENRQAKWEDIHGMS